MSETLRFVKRLGAIYRVLIEIPAGCWLIDCNGPSPPFFATNLDSYERVPAPESWMSAQAMTPAQEARLQMIQPLLDCDDCISDKSLRYRMAADAAQQHHNTPYPASVLPVSCYRAGHNKKRAKKTNAKQPSDRASDPAVLLWLQTPIPTCRL